MEPAIILPLKNSPPVSSFANPNTAETVSPRLAESGRSQTQSEAHVPTLIEKEQDNVSPSGKEKRAKNTEDGHAKLLKPETKKQAKVSASRASKDMLQRERYELSMRLEEEKFFAFMQGRPFVPGIQWRALASAKRINDFGTVTYPEGIQAPLKKLDRAILGKRYDREFMLQFKLFCRDKPQFSSNLDGLGVERPPPLAESDLSRSRHTQGAMGDSIQGAVDGSGGLNSGSPGGVTGQLPTRTRSKRGRQKKASLDPNTIPPLQQQQPVREPVLRGTKAVVSLRACENPWTPWSVGRNKRAQDQNLLELTRRKGQALLNKLASKNFDSIFGQVFGMANTSEDEKKGPVLDLIVKLVVEHASETPLFVEVFARLSKEMTEKLPTSVQDGITKTSAGNPIVGGQLFRKYLLNRCKEDTERSLLIVRARLSEPNSQDDKVAGVRFEARSNNGMPTLFSDEYYDIYKAKRQCLNLTHFTGELFKAQMLSESNMHQSIKKCLANIDNPKEADIEMLCILLTKVGQELDTPKARGRIDGYFERVEKSLDSHILSPRLRCLLLDVIDLRKRNWGPRERIVQLHEQVKQPQGTSQKQPTSKQGRNPRRKKSPSRITPANNVPSASGHNTAIIVLSKMHIPQPEEAEPVYPYWQPPVSPDTILEDEASDTCFLAESLIYMATSPSSLPTQESLDKAVAVLQAAMRLQSPPVYERNDSNDIERLHGRLESIEEELRASKEETSRAFLALNAKLDDIMKGFEAQTACFSAMAKTIEDENRKCLGRFKDLSSGIKSIKKEVKASMVVVEEVDSDMDTPAQAKGAGSSKSKGATLDEEWTQVSHDTVSSRGHEEARNGVEPAIKACSVLGNTAARACSERPTSAALNTQNIETPRTARLGQAATSTSSARAHSRINSVAEAKTSTHVPRGDGFGSPKSADRVATYTAPNTEEAGPSKVGAQSEPKEPKPKAKKKEEKKKKKLIAEEEEVRNR